MPNEPIVIARPPVVLDNVTDGRAVAPANFSVFLLNDDYTPYQVVVQALVSCFQISQDEAVAKMMQAHRAGQSFVGVYTRDVADSRVARAKALAAGYPLNFDVSPE